MSTSIKAKKVHAKPRISVNKLAEYLEAGTSRRKTILHDAKYPSDFKGILYRSTKIAVQNFFVSGFNDTYLKNRISHLDGIKNIGTPHQKMETTVSIEALKQLLKTDFKKLSKYEFKVNPDNEYLYIKDVRISVNPDFLVYSPSKNNLLGALRLHYPKSNKLVTDAQQTVALLVYEYLNTNVKKAHQTVERKMCFSVDVFRNSLECCSSSYVRKLKKVEDGCEEIAARWASI